MASKPHRRYGAPAPAGRMPPHASSKAMTARRASRICRAFSNDGAACRGIFDFDAVVASVLAATVLFMGMTAFSTGAHSFAEGVSLLESERTAITAADYLVKDCDLGVARCELGFAYPHEYGGRIGDAGRALSNATGKKVRTYANESAEGICAKRLMLNGTRAMVVVACVD